MTVTSKRYVHRTPQMLKKTRAEIVYATFENDVVKKPYVVALDRAKEVTSTGGVYPDISVVAFCVSCHRSAWSSPFGELCPSKTW